MATPTRPDRRPDRRRDVAVWCALVVALIAVPTGASAAHEPDAGQLVRPRSYSLEWTAPPQCPSREALARSIEEMLGIAEVEDGELVVRGTVAAERGSYVLHWTTESGGQLDLREPIRSTECRALGDAVALTVALALESQSDPTGPSSSATSVEPLVPVPSERRDETRAAQPEATRSPTADPSHPASLRSPRRASPRPEDPSRSFEVALRVAPLLAAGALPRVGGGLQAAVGLRWPSFGVDLFGVHLWPRLNRSETGSFQLGTAGGRACGWVGRSGWGIPLCGALEAGALRAEARGLSAPRVVRAPWVATMAGAGFAFRGSAVGVSSLAEGVVALSRPQFRVGDAVVFRGPVVHLRVSVGLDVFF